jgi:TonB family protein
VALATPFRADFNSPVNIENTDLLRGDEAPDEPAAGASRSEPPSRLAAVAARGATGAQGANVVVLSADPDLVELLRESVAGTHHVWRVDDVAHAADLVVASGNAVLFIDAALADHDTRSLITRIHQQFPDLAIIVAGRRDDEQELASLVSEGTIFRFLHKPASAERIRNFVDATQRRPNGTDLTATLPPKHRISPPGVTAEVPVLSPRLKLAIEDGLVRRWLRRSLLLLPVVLLAWGIIEWEPWTRMPAGTPGPVAAKPASLTDAGEEVRLQKLLDAAGLALSQGALIEPPGRNALELYRAVLERDPGNTLARRGLDSVAEELVVQAERALMEQDVTRLASAADAIRAVQPDHARLPFFVSQLERERAIAGQTGKPIPAFDTMGRPLEAPAATDELPSVRLQAFLQLANERMRSNQLAGTDGALGYVQSARQLAPADPDVVDATNRLGILLQNNTQKAIRDDQLDDADRWLQNAIELDLDRTRIATMRADIDAARIGNERADRARLLVLANQRIAQGRLFEPSADSALHYLDLLRAADPQSEGLADTAALLATQAIAEARAALAAGNLDRADACLRAAADADGISAEITELSARVMSARITRPAQLSTAELAVLPEDRLRRTFFAAPTYPTRAREHGIEGWVDLEYTVTRAGITQDAVVRAAEPAGVFDRVALDAVKHWRYEPRVVGGNVVEQRVAARLRFRLSE